MAQTGRRARREAQSKADRGRSRAGTSAAATDGRRRFVTWITVVVLTLVLIGAAVATVVATNSGSNGGSGSPTLSSHTLLRLPAASAVADGATPGVAYATDDLRDLVVRFDPQDGRVSATAHVPDRPAAMIRLGNALWVAEAVRNTVIDVDTRTLRIVRTVPVPAGPTSMAVFDGELWVVSVVAGEVTPVDPRTGRAGTPVDVPGGAVRIAAGYGALWITGTGNTLHHFVPPSGRREAVLEGVTVGSGPIGVATGAGSVWVVNAQGGTVSQVDPSELRVVHTFHVGGDPLSIAVAGRDVFVGDGTAQTVRTVSPAPGSKVLNIGTTPRQLLPVGDSVWVAGANPGRVLAVSPS